MGTQESEILPKKFTRNIFKLALHFFHFCEYKLISKISPKYWEHEKNIIGLHNWHITNFTRMPQQGDYDDNADKRIEWIVNKNYEN